MRRSLRSAFVLGVLAGLVLALARALSREAKPTPAPLTAPSPSLPAVTPPARTPVPLQIPEPVIGSDGQPDDLITGSAEEGSPEAWVEPVDGGCPDGYPIKAKEGSGIYHRPGGLSYERTKPDRCYSDPDAAEADGFRAAKR
ncbi:MAG TPA: hypothetical protein VF228_21125 [Iamia sp.]